MIRSFKLTMDEMVTYDPPQAKTDITSCRHQMKKQDEADDDWEAVGDD